MPCRTPWAVAAEALPLPPPCAVHELLAWPCLFIPLRTCLARLLRPVCPDEPPRACAPPPSRLQIRQNLDAAKSRIAESEKRLDVVMESYVSKAYW